MENSIRREGSSSAKINISDLRLLKVNSSVAQLVSMNFGNMSQQVIGSILVEAHLHILN